MEDFDLCMDLFFVFTITFAVIDGIEHEKYADHKSRNNTGKKQVTDGSTRSHTVHDKWDTWGNDNTQTTGNCNNCSGKSQVISQSSKDRYGHTSYSCHSGRSRTGDSSVEKAGNNHCTWHSCCKSAKKIGKYIKKFLGNTTFCHDDTGKYKHRYSQKWK